MELNLRSDNPNRERFRSRRWLRDLPRNYEQEGPDCENRVTDGPHTPRNGRSGDTVAGHAGELTSPQPSSRDERMNDLGGSG